MKNFKAGKMKCLKLKISFLLCLFTMFSSTTWAQRIELKSPFGYTFFVSGSGLRISQTLQGVIIVRSKGEIKVFVENGELFRTYNNTGSTMLGSQLDGVVLEAYNENVVVFGKDPFKDNIDEYVDSVIANYLQLSKDKKIRWIRYFAIASNNSKASIKNWDTGEEIIAHAKPGEFLIVSGKNAEVELESGEIIQVSGFRHSEPSPFLHKQE